MLQGPHAEPWSLVECCALLASLVRLPGGCFCRTLQSWATPLCCPSLALSLPACFARPCHPATPPPNTRPKLAARLDYGMVPAQRPAAEAHAIRRLAPRSPTMIKARESPDTVDAFIDETSFRLSGKPVLLYGTAVTAQLAAAIAAEDELRARYGLPRDLEIKWALQHQDPALKATVKQDLLARLSKHFRWLVTIRSGTDKDVAFLTSLNQLHRFAVEEGIRFLNIFH